MKEISPAALRLRRFDNVYRMADGCRTAAKIENNVPETAIGNHNASRQTVVVATIVLERRSPLIVGEVEIVGDVNIAPMRAINDNNVSAV